MGLVKLASLWKGKPGSKALLTGKDEKGRKVVMFANDKGGNEKRPDFRLMVEDGTGEERQPSPFGGQNDDEAPF